MIGVRHWRSQSQLRNLGTRRDVTKKFGRGPISSEVVNSSQVKRSVLLQGTIGDFSRAFNVSRGVWDHPDGKYRGRTGPISVPTELSNVITGVFSLDNRRIGRSYYRKSHAAALTQSELRQLKNSVFD